MTHLNCTTSYHHLSAEQRGQLQEIVRLVGFDNVNKAQAARALGVDRSTVTRELKRNQVTLVRLDPKGHKHYYATYEAPTAHRLAQKRHSSPKMALERYSLSYWAQLKQAMTRKPRVDGVDGFTHAYKRTHPDQQVPTTVTVYRYIDAQLIPGLRNIDLPRQSSRKQHLTPTKPRGKNKKILGQSIAQRDPAVLARELVGDWELDYVKGVREKHHAALLVMTERKTRYELIMKVPAYDAVTTLSYAKKLLASHPELPFRSITCDNGSEFSQLNQLKPTVYYCHAYASWERGTNEQTNGLLREYLPKGKPIEQFSDDYLKQVEAALNHKHRRQLEYQTASELMANEAK
jgi:IS30 family transposase